MVQPFLRGAQRSGRGKRERDAGVRGRRGRGKPFSRGLHNPPRDLNRSAHSSAGGRGGTWMSPARPLPGCGHGPACARCKGRDGRYPRKSGARDHRAPPGAAAAHSRLIGNAGCSRRDRWTRERGLELRRRALGDLVGIASDVTPDFGSLESAREGLDGAGVELGARRKCAIVGKVPGRLLPARRSDRIVGPTSISGGG